MIAKQNAPTEHEEAVALMQWVKLMTPKIPELDLLFAIPNGGARNVIVAKKLKAEGVKAGIPDYFLPVPKFKKIKEHKYVKDPTNGNWLHSIVPINVIEIPGLFLELKRSNGVPSNVSKAQKERMKLFEEQGYKCVIAYGWLHASKVLLDYLK
jgi:hypothetical protein